MGKRIKDTYQKHLWLFFSANVVIYWVISTYGFFNIELADSKMSELLSPKSIFFILSPILVLILNGLLSNPIKEFLVFWKINNRLPGCRAFTKYAVSDYRIDVDALKKKVGELPEEPSEQNRVWYKLYNELRDNEVVKGSHRDFLLTRDLCSIIFVFALFIIPIVLFYWKNSVIKFTYVGFLLMQYLIISISARNFGNRFVCNVLTNTTKENGVLSEKTHLRVNRTTTFGV